jgi:hypothetical protein
MIVESRGSSLAAILARGALRHLLASHRTGITSQHGCSSSQVIPAPESAPVGQREVDLSPAASVHGESPREEGER